MSARKKEKNLKILKEFLLKTRYPIEDVFFAIRVYYLQPKLKALQDNHHYLDQIRLSLEEAAYTKNFGKLGGGYPTYGFQTELLLNFIEDTEIGATRVFSLIHYGIQRGIKGSSLRELELEARVLHGYYEETLKHLRMAYAKIHV